MSDVMFIIFKVITILTVLGFISVIVIFLTKKKEERRQFLEEMEWYHYIRNNQIKNDNDERNTN